VPRCSELVSGQQPALFWAVAVLAKPGRALVLNGSEIRLAVILF
jgi:hypothetical protein